MPNLSGKRQDPALVALGKTIRNTRIAQGVSQEKLALKSEVDRSYLGRVERGDNNVALLTLAKLAHGLGISLAKLMQKARL